MGWIVLPGVEVTQKLTRVLSVVVDRRAAARPAVNLLPGSRVFSVDALNSLFGENPRGSTSDCPDPGRPYAFRPSPSGYSLKKKIFLILSLYVGRHR